MSLLFLVEQGSIYKLMSVLDEVGLPVTDLQSKAFMVIKLNL